MSTANSPGTGSFSLDSEELENLMGDGNSMQPVDPSVTKDMTVRPPAAGMDVYGETGVFNGNGADTDDTAIEFVMTAEQQEFSTRLLQLCGNHPIGQAIVTTLKQDAASAEDPWLLAEQALKILYAGQEDCLPHVKPYFYDQKVIENLFYGDKGLFLRFLGRGGFGSAVLVRNTDAEGKPRNEVWKIAHAPGKYDGKTQRWHSQHTDSSNQMFIERLNREADATAALGAIGIAPELLERGTITGSDGNEHPYFSTKFVPGMTDEDDENGDGVPVAPAPEKPKTPPAPSPVVNLRTTTFARPPKPAAAPQPKPAGNQPPRSANAQKPAGNRPPERRRDQPKKPLTPPEGTPEKVLLVDTEQKGISLSQAMPEALPTPPAPAMAPPKAPETPQNTEPKPLSPGRVTTVDELSVD
jgi:hypothetical protein